MAFFQNDRADDNDDVDELDEDDSNEFHAEIDSMSGIQRSTDDKDDPFPLPAHHRCAMATLNVIARTD